MIQTGFQKAMKRKKSDADGHFAYDGRSEKKADKKDKKSEKQYAQKIRPEYTELLLQMNELQRVVSECGGMANADLKKFTEQIRVLAENWKIES